MELTKEKRQELLKTIKEGGFGSREKSVIKVFETFIRDKLEEKKEKRWYHAFLEENWNDYGISFSDFSDAECLQIEECGDCDTFRKLMEYVLKFDEGGFWFEDGNLYFTLGGLFVPKATYEHARKFLDNY